MPKQCEICNKTANRANSVCFSNKHYTYKQQPNLHTVKTMVNGTVKKISVCASCIKANKVKKAV
ncbi:MAG TPA: 50S ribosomal protein L28 [Candidatus Gastranaerophilales bacterium]|nr:50S ribosomal protein L28 [Candidatus Gastranaerophilales bacterium]